MQLTRRGGETRGNALPPRPDPGGVASLARRAQPSGQPIGSADRFILNQFLRFPCGRTSSTDYTDFSDSLRTILFQTTINNLYNFLAAEEATPPGSWGGGGVTFPQCHGTGGYQTGTPPEFIHGLHNEKKESFSPPHSHITQSDHQQRTPKESQLYPEKSQSSQPATRTHEEPIPLTPLSQQRTSEGSLHSPEGSATHTND